MRKPRGIQGYEIQKIYGQVKTKGQKVSYPFLGLGINGPNMHNEDTKQLRALGHFLIKAADWIDFKKKKGKK